jgi:hypothetical protein
VGLERYSVVVTITKEYPMFSSPTFLRRVLLADALSSAAMGVALLFATGPLAALFGMPPALLRGAGILLVPFAATVLWAALSERISRPLIWTVVAMNGLWVVDSAILLVSGWVAPTALGLAFVIAQALAVAAFAEMQALGLRRSTLARA